MSHQEGVGADEKQNKCDFALKEGEGPDRSLKGILYMILEYMYVKVILRCMIYEDSVICVSLPFVCFEWRRLLEP